MTTHNRGGRKPGVQDPDRITEGRYYVGHVYNWKQSDFATVMLHKRKPLTTRSTVGRPLRLDAYAKPWPEAGQWVDVTEGRLGLTVEVV